MTAFRPLPPPPGRRSGRPALALSSGLLLSQRCCRLPPVDIMIICRDLISHAEMFSEIYKVWEVAEGCVWRWRGRWSVGQRVTSMNCSLVEMPLLKAPRVTVPKSTVITGVDIVMNHHLQETSFTKRSLQEVHQRLHEVNQRET